MPDPKDPHSDEHIEDLLSQLQGIFGKLSRSEEEESQQKVEPPKMKATPPVEPAPEPLPLPEPLPTRAPAPMPAPMAPVMEPSPAGAPPISEITPLVEETAPIELVPLSAPEQTLPPEPVSMPPIAPVTPPMPVMDDLPVAAPIEALPDMSAPLSAEELQAVEDDGHSVQTVIYYPVGHESDGKMLAEKLETMAPKFTKVAFQLRVAASVPYDLKGDARQTLLTQPVGAKVRAVFFIVERPLDEVRKKGITSILEPRSIYFQEVPFLSIAKKAFYTDLLLGLVFFFDSLKQNNGSSGPAS